MPTSVTAARQFLTEEAARALDEAVAVARRRSHAQTTSLHAVSALLSLPSSTLREACTRTRSSAYPSRLQFRALELSVGVSLDRLPSSKSVEDPPISNSLMAAIKRSQASQRRHPESYHLQQLHSSNNNNANATGCSQAQAILKVELKYLILSILDDPIVSRVFGEAGFRSCDIKLALVRPPVAQVSSRFSRAHCPPIFLCNLTDSVFGRVGYNLLFPGQEDGVDENCKRISEVMAKKSGKSPLLVGVCALEALRAFTESLTKGKSGILDGDLVGSVVISIEKEINEIVNEGNDEKMGLKLKEVEATLEKCNGSGGGGVVLHFGDLKGLIFDGALGDFVSPLVLRLAGLMEVYRRRLWLMGAVDSVEIYRKFCDKFPNVEKDWDLQLLPITSSKSSFDGAYPKSSLMRSFVPFGGLFPTPSDLRSPLSGRNQSIPRCNLCNEKYEQEVDAVKKAGSTVSVADQYSENLPSWLRMAAVDTSRGEDVAKTKAGESMLSAKVLGLQKKWNDICQRLHCTPTVTKLDNPSMSQVPIVKGPQFSRDQNRTSSGDLSINESLFPNQSPSRQIHMQTNFLPKSTPSISCTSEGRNMNFHSVLHVDVPSVTQQTDKDVPWFHHPRQSLSSCSGRTPSSFVPPVTTDLKLGTIYASTSRESNTTKSLNHQEHLQRFSGSVSTEFDANSETTSYQFAQSSSCSGPASAEQFDLGDYKSIRKALAEKVGWQDEAVNSVSQAVSQLRHKYRSFRGINCKGDNWLTFLGPDRVGKKRIASALADVLFGSQECVVSLDLSSQDKLGHSNSIFECKELSSYDEMSRGKTMSDLIAEELRKKPHSVVFLENVDKADYGVQHSLDLAIRTGKFPDSRGREISINNMVLITTSSSITKGNVKVICENKVVKFPEKIILGAKNWQMQILVGSASDDASKSNYMGVRVATVKEASTSTSANKRKTMDVVESSELEKTDTGEREHKVPRSCLDLNFPVEEADEEDMGLGHSKSESMSESSESWLEELFSQVHKKIHFKPFDFDGVADKIVKEISSQCQRTVGTEVALEIGEQVMVQMLAAAWLSDKREAIEDWVAKVLGRSLVEVGQKYNLSPRSVLKLVACEGDVVKEQAPGIRLPAKINLN